MMDSIPLLMLLYCFLGLPVEFMSHASSGNLISTVLTNPSLPLNVSVITPTGQDILDIFSVSTRT